MRFLMIALLPVAALLALWCYRYLKRMLGTFGLNTEPRAVRIGIGAAALCMGLFAANIASVWAVALLHLLAIGSVLQLLHFILKKILGRSQKQGCKTALSVAGKIYGSGILPLVLTAAVLVFGYYNLHTVVRTDYTVQTQKDIPAEGYRVALIADVHYGVSLDYEQLLEKCEEISEAKADVVILCGDIVDDATAKEQVEEVFCALGGIESTYGVFYVYGNHDRPFAGLESDYTEQELITAIEKNGITILRDEVYAVTEDFVLLGREDRGFGGGAERASVETLLEGVDKNDFILTLDHQPNEYKENGEAGVDLLLSGHTHGGHFWPLNLFLELFPVNDAVYGYTQIDGDSAAIVTGGFAGWSYPVKTAAPAEYVIIDVKR